MRRIYLYSSLMVLSFLLNGFAIQKSELSPEAAALIPDVGSLTTVVMKDGAKIEGTIISETATNVTVKIRRGATIFMSKEIARTDIQAIQKTDAGKMLAAKLLLFKLDPKNSLLEQDYRKPMALFDEFIAKCGTLPEAQEITKRRNEFADELKNVERGMAKVDGTWLTPVCAAVKRFNMASEQIATISKRPDFETNPKVKEFIAGLVEKRRVMAKSLPKMMQDHLPKLIENKEFDDAITEMTAFLHFWIRQVIKSEGKAEDVIQGMDFDYILRMQKKIMDAYKAAKPKDVKPAKMPSDKDMIYIPGSYFLMGGDSTDPKNDAFPAHIVFVSPFVIDKYEVTNEDYRKFVEHVKKTGDSSMEHPAAPPLKKHDAEGWKVAGLAGDRQPVAGIDWFDAFAYAKWIDKRLPTEAEWEKAARGLDLNIFPWGTNSASICAASWSGGRELFVREIDRQNPQLPPEPPSGCGCFAKKEPPPPPPPTHIPAVTWEVDKMMPALAAEEMAAGKLEWPPSESFTNDISPYGLMHMAGNVSEWVSDVYTNDYYGTSELRDPAGPDAGKIHVYRGGSYLSTKPEELSAVLRSHPTHQKMEGGCMPDGRPFIGFRCAKSLSVVVQPVLSTAMPDAKALETRKEAVPSVREKTAPAVVRPVQESKQPSTRGPEATKKITPLLKTGVSHQ